MGIGGAQSPRGVAPWNPLGMLGKAIPERDALLVALCWETAQHSAGVSGLLCSTEAGA